MTHRYQFAKTEQAQKFCEEILEAIVASSTVTEDIAISKIETYWEKRTDIESDPLLYHELPYYYAMCILHHPVLGDNVPFWWKDPTQWPPPERFQSR